VSDLWTPLAGIASRLRPHPAGLALLVSEQAFQKQTWIRRNTLLREQRTYPLLDLPKRRRPQQQAASMTVESWLPMDSEPSEKGNCNARSSVCAYHWSRSHFRVRERVTV
jgi:hypothetical protein